MLAFVYGWVKSIIIYLILITVVMNLLGKSSYKKYIGIFTGMVLVLLILSPIIKIFKIEDSFNSYIESNNYVVESNDISNQLFDVVQGRNELVLNEYKERIVEQIKQIVENNKMFLNSANINIYEEQDNKNYGRIKNINIVASYYMEDNVFSSEDHIYSADDEDHNKKINIDKIKINKIKQDDNIKDNLEETKVLSIQEIELKKTIADFYNMPLENININIENK